MLSKLVKALLFVGAVSGAYLYWAWNHPLQPGSDIYVVKPGTSLRAFARELGATWAGDIADESPELLDAIIDLRAPRILLIIRNAFGGAYAASNLSGTNSPIAGVPSASPGASPGGSGVAWKSRLAR